MPEEQHDEEGMNEPEEPQPPNQDDDDDDGEPNNNDDHDDKVPGPRKNPRVRRGVYRYI